MIKEFVKCVKLGPTPSQMGEIRQLFDSLSNYKNLSGGTYMV